MKLLHISDTHSMHHGFPRTAFEGVDILIHSGDCSNPRDPKRNKDEVLNFIDWYSEIPVKYKIFVAGNHDTSIERKLVKTEDFHAAGIIYLENDSVQIEGWNIYGSPITPTFGEWAFMKARDKTHEVWQQIPDDTDILIVHGPPKGVRDLSYNRMNELEFCGDKALGRRIYEIKPKLMCFGHIHDCEGCDNQGVSTFSRIKTIFSNGSCVTDGRFDWGLTSFGNTFIL